MKALVVAGEASADLHAAVVFEKLRKKFDIELIGIGGENLEKLGLKPIATPKQMGVVGLVEAIGKIPQALRLIGELDNLAEKDKPDFAFLCDLPDFNLRLAPKLKTRKVPVFYYVAPQVWAWRSGRVVKIRECVDMLFSIFPFEYDWFRARSDVNIKYVGHPAIEEIPEREYTPESGKIALLPGSRASEIKRVQPVLTEAVRQLLQTRPDLRFVVPVAPTIRTEKEQIFAPMLAVAGDRLQLLDVPAHEVLYTCEFAIVTSGTATLETAVVGCPMTVVYKVNALSAFIFKNFVEYQGPIAMANLIHVGFSANERVVPELIQHDCTPEKIVETTLRHLGGSDAWQSQRDVLKQTRGMLTTGDELHSEKVVHEISKWIEQCSQC